MRRVMWVAACVMVAAVVAGCGGSAPGEEANRPAPSASEPLSSRAPGDAATRDDDVALSPSATVTVDGQGWSVTGGRVVSGDPHSGAVVRVPLSKNGTVAVALEGPDGLAAQVEVDGTVAVTVEDEFVVGLSAAREVASGDGAGDVVGRWAVREGGALVVELADAPVTHDGSVAVTVGIDSVGSVTWGVAEGGASLAVTPSTWGRAGGVTVARFGWADVVERDADADIPGMEEQFACHALGASAKDTWNLEPWRPAVPLPQMMAALCNPESQ